MKVDYSDSADLIVKLKELAEKPEYFEGVVAKAKFIPTDVYDLKGFVKTSSLLLFKVK